MSASAAGPVNLTPLGQPASRCTSQIITRQRLTDVFLLAQPTGATPTRRRAVPPRRLFHVLRLQHRLLYTRTVKNATARIG